MKDRYRFYLAIAFVLAMVLLAMVVRDVLFPVPPISVHPEPDMIIYPELPSHDSLIDGIDPR